MHGREIPFAPELFTLPSLFFPFSSVSPPSTSPRASIKFCRSEVFPFHPFFARTLTPFPRICSASYLNEKGFLPLRFEARGELGEGEGGGQSEKGARLGARKGAERDY